MDTSSIGPNPYDYVNEVTDPTLFAGRKEELSKLQREVSRLASGYAVAPMSAIVGERRIGKTSAALRLQEICKSHEVFTLRITLMDMTAADPWAFWHEIFHGLLANARRELNASPSTVGFRVGAKAESPQLTNNEAPIEFFRAHGRDRPPVPPNYLVNDGLRDIVSSIIECGPKGVMLIIDEAHLLVPTRVLVQQIRSAIRAAGRCGIVFVGETELSQLFADRSQPLFAQGDVIPLENFAAQADVAECALLPLSEEERQLVSPMTMDYLVRLSQGKPNQIRLICNSIYNRYQKGQQADLNIAIEALDDVLENIAAIYTDYDVRQKVEAIRTLSSVDLETLYNMTRYPNWTISDLVALDESFRSEGTSQAALLRRETSIIRKREDFVLRGLMSEDTDKCVLAGDEFLALYLRFWYEIRKHGRLSRSLVLGKGPPTPFGERIEKLVRFFCWELGRRPSIVINTFNTHDQGSDEQVAAVMARFEALESLQAGEPFEPSENLEFLAKWFGTCELVSKPGRYYIVYFFVRNLQNPRETVGIEIYFYLEDEPLIITDTTLLSLRQRAEDCKILVEGWKHFAVKLPSLNGLLDAIGGPRVDELLTGMSTLARWHLASVQHVVGTGEEARNIDEADSKEEETFGEWYDLYASSRANEAEESLNRHLAGETDRRKNARLYNDRGYVRYGLNKRAEAKQDLQLAFDFHFANLPLTLSNLSVGHIDEDDFEKAIENICDAMFLTLSAEDVSAGTLRLRLLPWSRTRKVHWEQHPANVMEASYVNLNYAMVQSGSKEEAVQTLQEGIDLMPSSPWLKLALARTYLYLKRYDLAAPIYEDLSAYTVTDRDFANEIRAVRRLAPRRRSGGRRGNR